MRVVSTLLSVAVLCVVSAVFVPAMAAAPDLLVEAINVYRGQVQRCGQEASEVLTPLAEDPRLRLSVDGVGDLQQALTASGYPMVTVQAISLSGPRDAQAAMAALQESFCKVLLDPQFVDIGVNQQGREWRIVLARPLLDGRLGDWQAEGQALLQQINAARARPRQCGGQSFGSAGSLRWNASLGSAAVGHSRAMANGDFFSHVGRDGRIPSDRAELEGFAGAQVAENLAAGLGSTRRVVESWLASPGHCANLMNPRFGEFGAAYAVDPQSDAGIYWAALFGAP